MVTLNTWSNVATLPTLTNLLYQVTALQANGSFFSRLATP